MKYWVIYYTKYLRIRFDTKQTIDTGQSFTEKTEKLNTYITPQIFIQKKSIDRFEQTKN